MKRTLLSLVLGLFVTMSALQAQHVSVNINIGSQPAWGPIGYDYVDYYYYLPDINCYYGVNQGLFFYFNAGSWVGVPYLPPYYRNYDFNTMYKVVLVGPDPWRYNKRHGQIYAQYRGSPSQPIIRYSHDKRYYNSRRNEAWWYDRRDNNHRYKYSNDHKYNNGRSSHPQSYSNGRRSSSNNYYRPQNQHRDTYNASRSSSPDNRTNRQKSNNNKSERRSAPSNMSNNRSTESYYVETSSQKSSDRSSRSFDSNNNTNRSSQRSNRR